MILNRTGYRKWMDFITGIFWSLHLDFHCLSNVFAAYVQLKLDRFYFKFAFPIDTLQMALNGDRTHGFWKSLFKSLTVIKVPVGSGLF